MAGRTRKASAPMPALEEDEIDAVLLGLRCLLDQDPEDEEDDAGPARRALGKIEALLPPPRREPLDVAAKPVSGEREIAALVERAIEAEETLRLSYVDAKGRVSERVIWPVAVGFFIASEAVAAWCESRRDFRHFRLDRIRKIAPTGKRMGRRHRLLLAEWRAGEDRDGW